MFPFGTVNISFEIAQKPLCYTGWCVETIQIFELVQFWFSRCRHVQNTWYLSTKGNQHSWRNILSRRILMECNVVNSCFNKVYEEEKLFYQLIVRATHCIGIVQGHLKCICTSTKLNIFFGSNGWIRGNEFSL